MDSDGASFSPSFTFASSPNPLSLGPSFLSPPLGSRSLSPAHPSAGPQALALPSSTRGSFPPTLPSLLPPLVNYNPPVLAPSPGSTPPLVPSLINHAPPPLVPSLINHAPPPLVPSLINHAPPPLVPSLINHAPPPLVPSFGGMPALLPSLLNAPPLLAPALVSGPGPGPALASGSATTPISVVPGTKYTIFSVSDDAVKTTCGLNISFNEKHKYVLPFARAGDIIVVPVPPAPLSTPSPTPSLLISNPSSASTGGLAVAMPFITSPAGTEKTCMETLIRCVIENKPFIQEKITVRQLFELYRHMQTFHLSRQPKCETVEDCFSCFASIYNVCDREITASDVLREYPDKVSVSSGVVQAVLGAWHENQDIRLLRALGIKDTQKDTQKGMPKEKEIQHSYMAAHTLYSLILENPFLVHSLTTIRAEAIALTISHKTTDFDLECSRALSAIHSHTIDIGDVFTRLDALKKFSRIGRECIEFLVEKQLIYVSGNRVYLRQLYDMERSVATRLAHIVTDRSVPKPMDLSCLDTEDESDGRKYSLDQNQKNAVISALTGDSGMCVITGCAGSGKTTIMQKMVKILATDNWSIRCTSFTGQATSNIQKKVGILCENEHTMIQVRKAQFSYLIVDEFSMQSLELTYNFFLAFPHNFRLIVVGDPNQLQPLSFGDVLMEIIKSNTVPVHELKKSYRVLVKNGVTDCIIENANRFAYWGSEPFAFTLGDNFSFLDERNPGELIRKLVAHIVANFKAGVQTKDFIIISPFKEEIPEINRMVQQMYLAGKKCMFRRMEEINGKEVPKWKVYQETDNTEELAIRAKERRDWLIGFYVGDLVRCTKNSHRNKIYNGDEGIVIDVAMSGVTALMNLADGPKEMLFPIFGGERDLSIFDLTLFYAATTHLMQGAQREKVIGYFHKVTPFVDRPNIYVLFTRASGEVLLMGNKNLVQKAVNNLPRLRNNTLSAWLMGLLPQLAIKDADTRMQEEIDAVDRELTEELEREYGITEYDDGDGDICEFD